MLSDALLFYVMLHYVTLYYVMFCYVMLCTLNSAISSWYIILLLLYNTNNDITLLRHKRNIVWYECDMLCGVRVEKNGDVLLLLLLLYSFPCPVMLCYIMLCYVMLYHVMLYQAMFCYVMSHPHSTPLHIASQCRA